MSPCSNGHSNYHTADRGQHQRQGNLQLTLNNTPPRKRKHCTPCFRAASWQFQTCGELHPGPTWVSWSPPALPLSPQTRPSGQSRFNGLAPPTLRSHNQTARKRAGAEGAIPEEVTPYSRQLLKEEQKEEVIYFQMQIRSRNEFQVMQDKKWR